MRDLTPVRHADSGLPQMTDRKLISEIRSTSKKIGRVLPVLMNPKGEVIDGYHRLQTSGKWPKRILRFNALQTRVARLVINRTRRTANTRDYQELAQYLQKTEPGKDRYHVRNGKTIARRITDLTGIPYSTVMDHIGGTKYVGPTKPSRDKVTGSVTSDKGLQRSQKPRARELRLDAVAYLRGIKRWSDAAAMTDMPVEAQVQLLLDMDREQQVEFVTLARLVIAAAERLQSILDRLETTAKKVS